MHEAFFEILKEKGKVLTQETPEVNPCSSLETVKNWMRKGEVYFIRDEKSVLYQRVRDSEKKLSFPHGLYRGS